MMRGFFASMGDPMTDRTRNALLLLALVLWTVYVIAPIAGWM